MSDEKKAPVFTGFAKAIDVERLPMQSPLSQRVRDMVQAYEAYQSKERGYKFVAVRTRQAIVRKGIKAAVIRACSVRPSPGFRLMVANGMAHLTYEWIALEHPTVFSKKTLEQARKRLETFEVTSYPGSKPGIQETAKKAVEQIKAKKDTFVPIAEPAAKVVADAKAKNKAKAHERIAKLKEAKAKKALDKMIDADLAKTKARKAAPPAPEPAPEPVKRPRGWNLRRKEKAPEPAPEPAKKPAKRRVKGAALATAGAGT